MMPDEAQMRLHRCSFAGHRPEKLKDDEATVRAFLQREIDLAVQEGFCTFLTGMAMGADLWAAEEFLLYRQAHPDQAGELHLIAVTPFPGFAARWKPDWHAIYTRIWRNADHRVIISPSFADDVFERRNRYLVVHAARLIACYNGEEGGTHQLIAHARSSGLACRVLVSH